MLAVTLAVAIPVSLSGTLGLGRRDEEPSGGAVAAGAGAVAAPVAAQPGAAPVAAQPGAAAEGDAQPAAEAASEASSLRPQLLSARVADYFPLRKGATYTYEVFDEKGPVHHDITYRVVGTEGPGVFLVRVTPGASDRRLRWEIDSARNTLSRRFLLPDAETGRLLREESHVILKLPAEERLTKDFVEKGVRVHARPADVRDHSGCLLVELREGDERRFEYYKEGVGLVAVEVYAAEDGRAERPDDKQAAGRRIYARYLKRDATLEE